MNLPNTRERFQICRNVMIDAIKEDIHMQLAHQCPKLSRAYWSSNFVAPSVFTKGSKKPQYFFTESSERAKVYLSLIADAIVIDIGWTYYDIVRINSDQSAENPEYMCKKIVAEICDPTIKQVFCYEFCGGGFKMDDVLDSIAGFVINTHSDFVESYISILIIADNDAKTERQFIQKYGLESIKDRAKIKPNTVLELYELAYQKYKTRQSEYFPTEN